MSNSVSPAFITVITNVNSGGANNTANAGRAANMVEFPTADTYNLFTHIRVGSGGYNRNRLFYEI